MQIGLMNHPALDVFEEIAWAVRQGFEFIDFTFEPPAADPDQLDLVRVREVLEASSLGVIGHTAWYVPLGSPFAGIRQAALEEFRRCLTAAHAIGARIMNSHYRRLPHSFTATNAVDWHVATLAPLCEEAALLDMTIVLEHVPEGGPEQLPNFVEIMRQVPRLGFHLDTGHAKLEAGRDRLDEYLQALGSRLMHVHLSDNDGTADQHLPLGAVPRNGSDWPEVVRKLKGAGYDGTITLEVFSPHREYLLLSRDLLRRWWNSSDRD